MTLDDFLNSFKTAKADNSGGFLVSCPNPSHGKGKGDLRPSLAVSEADDRILINCYAGCSTESILDALGLSTADLFYEKPGKPKVKPKAKKVQVQRKPEVYTYVDREGNPLYRVHRIYDRNGDKSFRQQRKTASGWDWGLKDTLKVLYRLPEVLGAIQDERKIFICEGEKDVDRLAGMGLVATTNAGGAKNWNEGYTDVLKRAKQVIICEDNDGPGRIRTQTIGQQLMRDVDVRVLRFPELPPGGDVSDWLDQGHTLEDLKELTRHAPKFEPAEVEEEPLTLDVRTFESVESEEVSWLWYPYIPRGKLTLMVGDPGAGKTFLTAALAAAVSCGNPWPYERCDNPGGSVILLNGEDGQGDTIKPRLEALEANCSKIHYINETERAFSMTMVDELRQVFQHVKPSLMTLDPVQQYLGSGVDAHRANETRPVLAALGRLAAEFNVAIVLVAHLNKNSGNAKAIYRAMGSIDFPAVARSMLLVTEDRDNKQRIMAHAKSSLAKAGTSLAFEIDAVGRFFWIGPVDGSADDFLGGAQVGPAVKDAAQDILNALEGGPLYGDSLESKMSELGHSLRTIQRARSELKKAGKIEMTKVTGKVCWQIPE